MHEINTAAEMITAAADPEANIIFGATINPELEGEIIITVVATGFDDSYFSNRSKRSTAVPSVSTTDFKQAEETAIKDIDMELPKDPPADFHTDKPMPNIWALDEDDSSPQDDQTTDDDTKTANQQDQEDDDKLDKPSFLRRLTKRRSTTKDQATPKKDK